MPVANSFRMPHSMSRILYSGIVLVCVLISATRRLPAANPPVDPTVFPTKALIYTLVVSGFWQTNCYILASPHGQAIVIDPGDDLDFLTDRVLMDPDTGKSVPATEADVANLKFLPTLGEALVDPVTQKARISYTMYRPNGKDAKRIYDVLQAHKLTLKYIVLSHGHIDHIGAIGFLKEKTGAKILMHPDDVRGKDGGKLDFSAGKKVIGYPKDTYSVKGGLPPVDELIKDGDLISLDGMVLQIIHTPGHSPGSICLRTRFEGRTLLFSGDILLRHSIGRTNFRDGSGDQMLEFKTIREKLFTLPDDTIVFPGHYETTTIGEEKQNNLFLKE